MNKGGCVAVLSCFLLLLAAGCDNLPFKQQSGPAQTTAVSSVPTYQATGTIVATIDGYPLTLEELNEQIAAINSRIPNEESKIKTREQKIDFLKNQLIRQVLLYQEAARRNVDKNPDIQKALEQTKRQLYALQLLKEETDKIEVTAQEIEDFYENYKSMFKEPEKRKVRELAVTSEGQAKELLIRLLQGESFSSMARAYSQLDTAAKGGDAGFITPATDTKFPKYLEVVFSKAMEEGSTSSIFRGPKPEEYYYIVQVEKIEGGAQESLSDAWDMIKGQLTLFRQKKQIEELVAEISKNANIEVKEDLVQ